MLGILYTSKSGNTSLKWRHIRGIVGRASGEASGNSLVNLITSRVISKELAEEMIQKAEPKKDLAE